MAYTNIDNPSDYFNTVLYTGNGSTQSITGVGFQPDWCWFKKRSGADDHALIDSVRGSNKAVYSDLTLAETTQTHYFSSFDSDGYTLGNSGIMNASGSTYVSWNWLAGGTASSNTDGSITSSVSANTTAGFSIVSYTGTGANATVGHGLGSAPSVIFFKNRTDTENWVTYHEPLFQNSFLKLNTNDASASNSAFMNGTSPTSSVFSLGTFNNNNGSGDSQIAYCFAEKKGFSKFGSYTGNGNADGTFVYTGFKPAMVIMKKSSAIDDWALFDNKRDVDNVTEHLIRPNTNAAEEVHANFKMDLLSSGFKLKTTDGKMNGSGASYIYMCFASNPFVTSTGIPTTAR